MDGVVVSIRFQGSTAGVSSNNNMYVTHGGRAGSRVVLVASESKYNTAEIAINLCTGKY
jgi:hypothetical protein